eukprot:scaffold6249_cov395-Prasinococcus_capsulatus_cf.AAC.1
MGPRLRTARHAPTRESDSTPAAPATKAFASLSPSVAIHRRPAPPPTGAPAPPATTEHTCARRRPRYPHPPGACAPRIPPVACSRRRRIGHTRCVSRAEAWRVRPRLIRDLLPPWPVSHEDNARAAFGPAARGPRRTSARGWGGAAPGVRGTPGAIIRVRATASDATPATAAGPRRA